MKHEIKTHGETHNLPICNYIDQRTKKIQDEGKQIAKKRKSD